MKKEWRYWRWRERWRMREIKGVRKRLEEKRRDRNKKGEIGGRMERWIEEGRDGGERETDGG